MPRRKLEVLKKILHEHKRDILQNNAPKAFNRQRNEPNLNFNLKKASILKRKSNLKRRKKMF